MAEPPEIDLFVPLVAAVVFTLGGYGIYRAERHAEAIKGVLGFTFLICAMLAVLALLAQVADRTGAGATGRVYATQGTRTTAVRPPELSMSGAGHEEVHR